MIKLIQMVCRREVSKCIYVIRLCDCGSIEGVPLITTTMENK